MKRILLFIGIVYLFTGITIGQKNQIGEIFSINPANKEIIVNVHSGINLNMGDLLQIETESGKIILDVTFPMQTVSKCKIKGNGKLAELTKGMPVYRYNKETDNKNEITVKTGEVQKFGDIEFVFINGGMFSMGSPKDEKERINNETEHKVTVSPFWMAKYEIKQKEYADVMKKNPSNFNGLFKDSYPVETVSWYEAVEFCNNLSKKLGLNPYYYIDKNKKDPHNNNSTDELKYTVTILGGNGFRLPTEAEWEFACRGGSATVFHFGDKLDSTMANFDGNYPYDAEKNIYRGSTTEVGSFKANSFGLYDMHGNVNEWCYDWYGNYSGNTSDPKGAVSGNGRVVRGGSWSYYAHNLRSAYRGQNSADYKGNGAGFRIVRSSD